MTISVIDAVGTMRPFTDPIIKALKIYHLVQPSTGTAGSQTSTCGWPRRTWWKWARIDSYWRVQVRVCLSSLGIRSQVSELIGALSILLSIEDILLPET